MEPSPEITLQHDAPVPEATNPKQTWMAIEAGINLGIQERASIGMLNLKTLFPAKIGDNRFDYLIDYSLGFGKTTPMVGEGSLTLEHIVMLGGRYYFDFGWVIDPYATLSIGLFATHRPDMLDYFMAIPLLNAGIGADYMFTENLGINLDLSSIIVSWQVKLGFKYIL